jgi:RimJ/RimL family protein N-acetyltransferase
MTLRGTPLRFQNDNLGDGEMHTYFMKTERIGFSHWQADDLPLASLLWGDKAVTRLICASGVFTKEEISDRLKTEMHNGELFGVEYWPIFDLSSGAFIGCCGLRPSGEEPDSFEIGFHLRPKWWGKGYAKEAATAVISYAFHTLHASSLFAGHHPDNEASRRLLSKLGFRSIGTRYYVPTGLYHPSYVLKYR